MKKKRVLVYAYCNENLGDDLFLHSLFNRYPNVEFVLFASKRYRKIFSEHNNIKIYDEKSLRWHLLNKIRISDRYKKRIKNQCEYAVYIGGSIFMEYLNWKNQYMWYRELFQNDRLFFIGCNWGPCITKTFKLNMTMVLKNMRDICFRDKYSYNEFRELNNTRYAPDILFGVDLSEYNNLKVQKRVFISVIDCESRDEDPNNIFCYSKRYTDIILEIVYYYLKCNYKISLVSFCSNENDTKMIEKITKVIPNKFKKNITELSYTGEKYKDILHELCVSEIVIGTRFHSIVLGIVARKKVLPIIYSNKTKNLLKDIGFKGSVINLKNQDENDIKAIVEQVSVGICECKVKEIQNACQKHFEKLDDVLY